MDMLKSEQPTIIRGPLPDGPAGTALTLKLMRQLSLAGARDPVVKQAASQIVNRAGVPQSDHRGQMDALFRWVRDHVRYARDPKGVELIQTARRTLSVLRGDCDDKTTLLAAMLHAIGHPSTLRYRVIGTARSHGFSHVYLVARLNGRDIPLDATPRGVESGWEYKSPTLMGDFNL